jgi:pSer/pThr/pTyr-binding forkhead associated (FHA) protein
MPRLDFYMPKDHRKPFVKVNLHEGEVTIGRAPDCTVQLSDERVSRHHAVIRKGGPEDEYWLEDRSRHGTRLNSHMVETAALLNAGDRIYIEGFIIIFQHDHTPPQDLEQADTRPD